MYESFFGLETAPFALSPDPRFLYPYGRTREAFAGLLHGILNQRGFVLLTGESGAGKSTLIRAALHEIPVERAASCLIFNPMVKADELLEMAMLGFGIAEIPESKAQRLLLFNQFLLTNQRAGRISVLFIDEAHTLSAELLEEVRLMANFETAENKLLQIVMAGQVELDEIMERRELRQLKQRIAVRLSLHPMPSTEEVGKYMSHRWRRAGGQTDPPFEEAAIEAIAQYSQGIPRTINAICDNALLAAFSAGHRTVRVHTAVEAATALRLQPAVGTASAAVPAAVELSLPEAAQATMPIDDLDQVFDRVPISMETPQTRFRLLGSES